MKTETAREVQLERENQRLRTMVADLEAEIARLKGTREPLAAS